MSLCKKNELAKLHREFLDKFKDEDEFVPETFSLPSEREAAITRYQKCACLCLTLQEAASGMHPKWQGGADSARPYKNQFRGHFDPIF